MNHTTQKWFRPASLLFGMALVFDFTGYFSHVQYENFLKASRERQQKLLEGLDRPDAEKIAGDWRRVGDSFRMAMAAVK